MAYDGSVIINTELATADYKRNLAELENITKIKLGDLSGLLVKGLGGLGFGLGIKELSNITSVFTDLQSRAELMAGGTGKASESMERLYEIANRAYSPLEKTAESFLNNSTTLNALNYSMEKQLDIADALTNGLVVSGAKGAHFEMVMGAITRGMAEGRLAGEDLNMVLKYGGKIAEGLAASLNISVVELKKFAGEGKLTSDVVAKGLLGNLDKWREEAEKMPATIADAFTNLNNKLVMLIGSMDKDWSFSQNMVKGLDILRDNLELIAKVTPPAVAIIGALALAKSDLMKKAGGLAVNTIKNTAAIAAETHEWSKQAGVYAAVRSQILGTTQVIGANTAAIIQNSLAEIANNNAKLARLDWAIAVRKSTIDNIKVNEKGAWRKHELIILENQLNKLQAIRTATQDRLTASTRTLAAAQGQLTLTGHAVSLMNKSLSSLMSFMGGPLGLAITGATAATYYFATAGTEAERMAKRYGTTLEELNTKYKELTGSTDEAANKIAQMSEERKAVLKESLELDLQKFKNDYQKALNDVFDMYARLEREKPYLEDAKTKFGFGEDDKVAQGLYSLNEKLKSIYAEFNNGNIEIKEAIEKIEVLGKSADLLKQQFKGVFDTSRIDPFKKKLEEVGILIKGVHVLGDKIKQTEQAQRDLADATAKVAYSAEDLAKVFEHINKNQIKPPTNLEEAAKVLVEATRDTKAFADAQDEAKKRAAAMALAMFHQAAAVAAANQDWLTFIRLMAQTNIFQAQLASGSNKSGGGGGGGINKANEQAQALKEVSMMMAKVKNDMAEVARLENLDELERFTELLKKAGYSAQEAARLTAEFKEAQAHKIDTSNLEVQLKAYEELRAIMPQAGAAADELKRKLIEQEIELLRAAGIAEEYLEKIRELRLMGADSSFMGGIIKGLHDYLNSATDAKMATDLVNTTLDGTSDAFFNIIKGSESVGEAFSKLGQSILDQLLKIAIQMIIMRPIMEWMMNALGGGWGAPKWLSSMGGSFGGLFGGRSAAPTPFAAPASPVPFAAPTSIEPQSRSSLNAMDLINRSLANSHRKSPLSSPSDSIRTQKLLDDMQRQTMTSQIRDKMLMGIRDKHRDYTTQSQMAQVVISPEININMTSPLSEGSNPEDTQKMAASIGQQVEKSIRKIVNTELVNQMRSGGLLKRR